MYGVNYANNTAMSNYDVTRDGQTGTFNAYIERDLDREMERTRDRPLPAGRLAPTAALLFGLALTGVSTAILFAVGGPMAAGLGVATILFYVFVYTIWLKPRSPWNAVRIALNSAPWNSMGVRPIGLRL